MNDVGVCVRVRVCPVCDNLVLIYTVITSVVTNKPMLDL